MFDILLIDSFFIEMFHAQRWYADFQSPMFESKVGSIFMNDFILFNDDILADRMGIVVKLCTKVQCHKHWYTQSHNLTSTALGRELQSLSSNRHCTFGWPIVEKTSWSVCHIPDDTLIICEQVEINSSQVIRLSHPQKHQLKLNLANSSQMHLNRQVCK